MKGGQQGDAYDPEEQVVYSTKFEKPSLKAPPNEKHSPEDGETLSKEAAYYGLHRGINLTGMGTPVDKAINN